ncbi:unnamed protein product [Effrenium voratum]|nr:unnamed protein product [Effrenium voratum]
MSLWLLLGLLTVALGESDDCSALQTLQQSPPAPGVCSEYCSVQNKASCRGPKCLWQAASCTGGPQCLSYPQKSNPWSCRRTAGCSWKSRGWWLWACYPASPPPSCDEIMTKESCKAVAGCVWQTAAMPAEQ